MTFQIIEHAVDDPAWLTEDAETQAELRARTVITLDRARRELRIPPGDNDAAQNLTLREQIESAVSFIQEDINIPLLTERVYVLMRQPICDLPLKFSGSSDAFVLFADKVRYQSEGAENYTVGEWPEQVTVNDGTTDAGDEDATQIAPGVGDGDQIAGNIIVNPPAGGWPKAAQSHYALYYTRGIKSTNRNLNIIRELVILKLREIDSGALYVKGTQMNSAYYRLKKSISFKRPTIGFNRLD